MRTFICLQITNFHIDASPSSITIGLEVSAFGRLGIGPSITLNNDFKNSDLSVNVNGNLNGDDTSTSISVGIKPEGIATSVLAARVRNLIPPSWISTMTKSFSF